MTESWKSVVPEYDRKILEAADFGGPQPWGRSPCLLIVDVVRSFTGSKPQEVLEAVKEYTTSCGTSAWETLPRMRTVLDAARAASSTVRMRGKVSQADVPQLVVYSLTASSTSWGLEPVKERTTSTISRHGLRPQG